MFDQLSSQLQIVMKFLRGEGKITEKNMAEALKMIRMTFLEADVNYRVVKDFEENLKNKALDQKVLMSLTPAQQVIKIVRDELTSLLGQEAEKLKFASHPPSIFMLVGLQGSGKTTTCGKLAKWVLSLQKNPLLVSFDLKRPAAQDQLKMISKMLNLPFYEMTNDQMTSPSGALKQFLKHAGNKGFDPLIVDTAGRLHIDDELMEELRMVKDILKPIELIYVGDSMTGQDAVKSAQLFEEKIGLTSIILSKLDGDARGGAALSIVSVTGKPIKFIGVGEKFDKLEVFHPDRMASRILGMGDILSLVEKAEKEADLVEAEALRIAKGSGRPVSEVNQLLKQFAEMKKMMKKSHFQKLLSSLPSSH